MFAWSDLFELNRVPASLRSRPSDRSGRSNFRKLWFGRAQNWKRDWRETQETRACRRRRVFFNSFVQLLDEKFPLVERRNVRILKFEPLHAPHVLAWRSCQWEISAPLHNSQIKSIWFIWEEQAWLTNNVHLHSMEEQSWLTNNLHLHSMEEQSWLTNNAHLHIFTSPGFNKSLSQTCFYILGYN